MFLFQATRPLYPLLFTIPLPLFHLGDVDHEGDRRKLPQWAGLSRKRILVHFEVTVGLP